MGSTARASGVWGSRSPRFESEVSLGDAVQASGMMWTASVDWGVTSTEMQQSQCRGRISQGGCRREEHQTPVGPGDTVLEKQTEWKEPSFPEGAVRRGK